MRKEARQVCELCKGEAWIYCEADAAFLCWACDERVHGANFLVGRHVRAMACAGCRSFAAGAVSGAGFAPIYSRCRFCDPAILSTANTCSYHCVSTAESASSAVVVAGKEMVGEETTRSRTGVAMAGEIKRKKRDKRALRRVIFLSDSILAPAAFCGRFAEEGWDECP